MNGIFVIDKPLDWTSFDVVNKLRFKFNLKKAGHTGTLDPKATGVLIVCLGKATKLVEFMIKANKEYEAEITLGASSTTDDSEGEITKIDVSNSPNREQIQEALKNFVGTFDQIPPNFSAKLINGKRAYKIAREGGVVKLAPKKVSVESIQLLSYKFPRVFIRIRSGSGFYVRSLARDLGQKLGTNGYLTGLRRTQVGDYTISHAKSIETVTENDLIPIIQVVDSMPIEAKRKLKI